MGRSRAVSVRRIVGLALVASMLLTVSIASGTSATTMFGWSNVGGGNGFSAINGQVRAIVAAGTDVYVGGIFSSAGGVSGADNIAKWNGSSWSAMLNGLGGTAINGRVSAILIDGTNVIVGGSFTNAGLDPQADYLAVWNGSTWSDIDNATTGDGALAGEVLSLAKNGSNLYVGGVFYSAPVLGGPANNPGDNVMRWDGSWHALGQRTSGDGAIQAWVNALIATPTGVIAGGAFQNVADGDVDYLAEYRIATNDWVGVFNSDTQFNAEIRALYQSADGLYVGGDFTDFLGITSADHLVLRDQFGWLAPGGANGTSAIRARVNSIVGSGSDVYVGGDFQNAGVGSAQRPTADRVAKWNGTGWSGLGSNGAGDGALNNNFDQQDWVRALALTPANALFAGGRFTNAGTIDEADYLASYSPPPNTPKPDGRIRKGSGTLVGNNIYNATGDMQTRIGAAARGSTITFTLSIQNDGPVGGRFKVAATGAAAANYQVTYFKGSTNITSAVVAGTYQTASVAPGNVFAITAKVKVLAGATVGSSVTRLVTISAVADPSSVDAVKLVGKRK